MLLFNGNNKKKNFKKIFKKKKKTNKNQNQNLDVDLFLYTLCVANIGQ